MANIVITSDAVRVTINYGNYSSITGIKTEKIRRDSISVSSRDNGVVDLDVGRWIPAVSIDGGDSTLIVDSVDGIVPTSNTDLLNKLGALML